MEKKWHFDVSYLLFAWILLLVLQQWWAGSQQTEVAPYSRFLELLRQD